MWGGGSDSEFLVTVEHAVIVTTVALNNYGFNRMGEVGSGNPHFGSISPDTITVNGLTQNINTVVTTVFENPDGTYTYATMLEVNLLLNYTFYIGRNDTQTYLGTICPRDQLWAEMALFTEADVGKTIPVYIGVTPPPYYDGGNRQHN